MSDPAQDHQRAHCAVPASRFFAIAEIGAGQQVGSPSDGDLWPSAWADDGGLYSACGDGLGFDLYSEWSDIVVNRIVGDPLRGLTGTRLAAEDDVSRVWGDSSRYNRKPTGMVAVDGNGDGRDELYLAVQDLRAYSAGLDAFNEAPTAGVVMSTDYGRTWQAASDPHFTHHVFTTVMFVDLGQSNLHAARIGPPQMVYAVGLDNNWRTSYNGAAPDPKDLYLARVSADAIMDRSRWEFYGGLIGGVPQWSTSIESRIPVLTDATKHHADLFPTSHGSGTISQGGVVYVPAYDRFIYSSWSEYTLELYEAPRPWGPWSHVVCRDFGPFPWFGPMSDRPRHGGYAATIPSKFISDDGSRLWLQSNWFGTASTFDGRAYSFGLRPVRLERRGTELAMHPPGTNLARVADVVALSSAARSGRLDVMNDGSSARAEDSWSGESRARDLWGYCWTRPVLVSRLRYTPGPYDPLGGWFRETPEVEARVDGVWVRVNAEVTPDYVAGPVVGDLPVYDFVIDPIATDGVRLSGAVGSDAHFTSVSELEVY